MPITDLNTKLVGATTASSTKLTPLSGLADITASIATPSHLFAQIYTAQYSEMVMIYGVENGELCVQRGMQGTAARSWPADACFKITEEIAGTPCDPEAVGGSGQTDQFTAAQLIQLLGFLNTDGCLELDLTGPDAPKLSVKNTGVTPGTYGGAVINSKGMFTDIPEQWPASALPVFDPCRCGCADCTCGEDNP